MALINKTVFVHSALSPSAATIGAVSASISGTILDEMLFDPTIG